MTAQKFEIHTLDVWGNADDGFDVNDAFRSGTFVTLPEDATDDDIAVILVDAGTLAEGYTGDSLTIEGDPEYMLCIYDSNTMEPLWNLDRIVE